MHQAQMNSTASILRSMGFDCVGWKMPLEGGDTEMLQITDGDGISWYVRADCTVTDALNRYRQKLQDFYGQQTTTKG